ncbi:MAG: PEGA domain-containing protein [Candidatus Moranbacteria bacterium]|nr:PEGA domain-containing protein [Candidatus Moranbacteria bacterium]
MQHLNRLHNLVFWIFLILFLTTSATVLFFTFGYRFSFERGIFVYTGSITIKANPRSVAIEIDGKSVPSEMIHNINQSYHITGLPPGEHLLRVKADGFRPWEKKVRVQSGISTEFWNVLLTRETYDRTVVATGPFIKAFPSSTGRHLALLAESDEETTVSILDRKTGETQQVFSSRSFLFDHEDQRNIEWSKSEDELLIPVRAHDDDERTVFLVRLETGAATDIRDISSMRNPENPRWHPSDDGSFFVISDGTLSLIRPDAKDIGLRTIPIATDTAAYDLSSRLIILLARDGSVGRLPVGADVGTAPETFAGPIPSASSFRNPFLVAYDERRVAVYDLGGAGYLYNDDGNVKPAIIPLFPSDMRGIQFSDDGKKLLFRSSTEISIAFTRDWDVQPARKSGDILQIARFSASLTDVQWAKDYEHVLLVRSASIEIAELDNRDRRNIETLIPSQDGNIRQILPIPADNELLFLATTDIETADTALSLVGFPEPVGIFGQ